MTLRPCNQSCVVPVVRSRRTCPVMRSISFALLLVACGGQTQSPNACATPSRVVTCDEQNFFTFTLSSDDGGHPTWTGSQCRTTPCMHGDACEVEMNGTFVEGVCE